jgi:hypothetical protein
LNRELNIKLFNNKYGICQLKHDEDIPNWLNREHFYSITKTSDELSIVCVQDTIPNSIKCEKEWRLLKIEGKFDFSLIGILASLASILAKAGVGIFAISSYDTDYILVKDKDIEKAVRALSNGNHQVIQ